MNQEILQKRLNELIAGNSAKVLKSKNLTKNNIEKIKSIHNLYNNDRCFIIGSSPSLKNLDLTKLNNEYTFTVNRGYLLKEQGLVNSDFHVISDTNTFKYINNELNTLKKYSKTVFCYAGIENFSKWNNVYYFDYIYQQLTKNSIFQTDLTKPLIAYHSVIHFAIQIAYYLGFKTIFLLGVDLDFIKNTGHCYKETVDEKQRQLEHSIKMANEMLRGIDIFGQFLNDNNVSLQNASPKGIVDCIKRVKYEELF